MTVQIRVQLDDRRIRRLIKDPQFILGPLKEFFAKSTLAIEAEAKERAPVDTGRLRGSIQSRLQPTRAFVRANVQYASHVEFGTRPHWPPLEALQPWARRHGFPAGRTGAFLVARAIARRGTRARPFMRPGANAALPRIRLFLQELGRAIEQRWRRG